MLNIILFSIMWGMVNTIGKRQRGTLNKNEYPESYVQSDKVVSNCSMSLISGSAGALWR